MSIRSLFSITATSTWTVHHFFLCLVLGVVCEEPERTCLSGPAGGTVLQV